LRALLTEMKNMSIAHKGEGGSGELSEADEIAVLSRARKQRDESIVAFKNGNRPDLAAIEEAQQLATELRVLGTYPRADADVAVPPPPADRKETS